MRLPDVKERERFAQLCRSDHVPKNEDDSSSGWIDTT